MGRRLQARSLSQASKLIVTYAIVVTGDAPKTIQVTGVEVGEKLQTSNLQIVESIVSTSIEETLGSGFSGISIASVIVPDVTMKSVLTQAPPTPGFLTPAPPTAISSTTMSLEEVGGEGE